MGMTFTILRTTLDNGTRIDTVIMDAAKVEALTNPLNPGETEESKRTVTLTIKQPSTGKADEIALEIPAAAVAAMADRNAVLDIRTDEGGIRLTGDAIKGSAAIGTDLYFRIVPIKEAQEQTEAKQALAGNQSVLTAAGGKQITSLGIPRKIETNFSGYATKVVLPLTGIVIPEQNRQQFLDSLRIFVEHTDGTTELLSGTVRYDNSMPVGIEFEINRFSRFQVIGFTAGSTNSEDDAGTNNAEKAAEFVPQPHLKPGSAPGTTQVVIDPPGKGNRLVIKVAANRIPTPGVEDKAPAGAGVTDPYTAGTDIKGADAKINKYIGVYEVDSNNRIVRFKLLEVAEADILFDNKLIDLYLNDVVQKDTAMLKVKGTAGGAVSIFVDNEAIIKKLHDEKQESVLKIPVVSAADAVEVEINGKLLKLMEEKSAVLRFETETAIYILPVSAIHTKDLLESWDAPSTWEKTRFTLSISLVDGETSAKIAEEVKRGKAEMLTTPVAFRAVLSYGEEQVEIHQFDRYVARLLPLSKEMDPDQIITGVYVGGNGEIEHRPTRVEWLNGVPYARINSLYNSIYTLIKHTLEFADSVDHWAATVIMDAGSRLIVNGVEEKLFEPDREINRAEFAAVMIRALGIIKEGSATSFADVGESEWYAEYVQTAQKWGLVEGYDDAQFGPLDSITREQAMTVVARAMKITGLAPALSEEQLQARLSLFEDSPQISPYAREPIAAGLATTVVQGRTDTAIAPDSSITRAEATALVMRLLRLSGLID